MSDPDADSTFDTGAATGASAGSPAVADSMPPPLASGQEQGDQSSKKRIDGLMSLAQKRTSERDAALGEIEELRAQLDAKTLAEQQAFTSSQVEAMFPERFAQPDADDGDDEGGGQPYVRVEPNMAPHPRYQARPFTPAEASTPAARYAGEQAEIAAMKAHLNQMGQRWYDGAKESGLLD